MDDFEKTWFVQFGTEAVVEAVGETLVPCPNPECDGEIDAQTIVAYCPRPNGVGKYETTDCCGLDREQLIELVDEEEDDDDDDEEEREPMADAYQFEVDS